MDQTSAFICSEEEMPRYCAAPLCNNSSLNGDPSLHLFKFPLKNEELLNKWLANTRRDQFFPNEYSYLCSEHFEPSDIIHTFGRTTLKPDAVPTIFKFSTMPTCYVPGCRSGYVVNGKVDPERHFFPPPKNHDKLENWNRAIRRTDKRLDNNCRVCDLHFEDYFIEKYFTLLSNGEIKKHEPGKWTLHPDAIPTKLLPPKKPLSSVEKKQATNVPSVEKSATSQSIPSPAEKTAGDECVATTVSTILLLDSSGKVSSVENIQIPQYLSSLGNLPVEGTQCSAADTIIILDSPAEISSLENNASLQCLPSTEQLPTEVSGCSAVGDTVILLDNSAEIATLEGNQGVQDLPPTENHPVERTDQAPDIIAIPDSPIKVDCPVKESLDSSAKADSPVKVSPKADSPVKVSPDNPLEEPSVAKTLEVSSTEKSKGHKRLPSVEEVPLEESTDQHSMSVDFMDKEASALRELLESRLAAAKAKDIDSSLMTLEFGNKRIEWVYRGSNRHSSSAEKMDDQNEIRPKKKICRFPSSREDNVNIKFSRPSDNSVFSYRNDDDVPKAKIAPKHRTVSVQTDDFFRPQVARKHVGGASLNSEDRIPLPVMPKAKKRFRKPEPLQYPVITPKYYLQLAKKQTGGKPVRVTENVISDVNKKVGNNTPKEVTELKQLSAVPLINVARKHTGGKILTKTNKTIGLAKKSTTLSLLEQIKKNIENNKIQTGKEDETKVTPGILMQSNKPLHKCGRACSRIKDDDPVKYSGKNPLQIPRLCGWKRYVEKKMVTYAAPCGRIFRSIDEISRYLWAVKSKLTIDLFCFDGEVYMANEFIPKNVLAYIPDVTFGKENVPVSCVNSVNEEYPPDIKYSSIRYPGKGVTLNLDPEFLCGCDCKDNCQNSKRCQCQQLTVNATEALPSGRIPNAGYKYRRLVEPLLTGIYECNSRCKCGPSCMNRVAQNGLQVRLQLFYTGKKGWGIRCLDDIPKGMFICTYAGELLTEQGASEEDRQLQDDYLAELDHIEVVEKLKEGYESDVLEADDEEPEMEGQPDEVKNTVAEDIKVDSDCLSVNVKSEIKDLDTLSIKEENSEDKTVCPLFNARTLDITMNSNMAVSGHQIPTDNSSKQDHPSTMVAVESIGSTIADINTLLSVKQTEFKIGKQDQLSTTDVVENVDSTVVDNNTSSLVQEPPFSTITLEDPPSLRICFDNGHFVCGASVTQNSTACLSSHSYLENNLKSNNENVLDSESPQSALAPVEDPSSSTAEVHSLTVHLLSSNEATPVLVTESTFDTSKDLDSHGASCTNVDNDVHIDGKECFPSADNPDLVLSNSKDNTGSLLNVQKPDQLMETDTISVTDSLLNVQSSERVMETNSQAVANSFISAQVSDQAIETNSHDTVNDSLNITGQEMVTGSQNITDNALNTPITESVHQDITEGPLSVQTSDHFMETDSQDVPDSSVNVQASDQFMETDSSDAPDNLLNVQTPAQIMETDSQDVPSGLLNMQASDQVMETDSKEGTDGSSIVQALDQVMETDSKEVTNSSLIVQAPEQAMDTDSKEDTDNSLIVKVSEQAMETDSQDAIESSLNIQPSDHTFCASDVQLDQTNFCPLAHAENSSSGQSLETSTEQPFTSFGNDAVQDTNPSNIQESDQEQTVLIQVEKHNDNSSGNPVATETSDSPGATIPTLADSTINGASQQSFSIGQLNETQNSIIYIENPPSTIEESGGQMSSDSAYVLTNIESNSQLATENSLNNDSVMIAIVTLPDGSQRICQLSQAHNGSLNNTETALCSTSGESNNALASSEPVTSLNKNAHRDLIRDPSATVQVVNENLATLISAESDPQISTEHSSMSLVPLSMLVESALQDENEKTVVQPQRQIVTAVPTASTDSSAAELVSLKPPDAVSTATIESMSCASSSYVESSEKEPLLAENSVEGRCQDKIDNSQNHEQQKSSQDHSVHDFSEAENCKLDNVENESAYHHCMENSEGMVNNSSNDQSLSSVESQEAENCKLDNVENESAYHHCMENSEGMVNNSSNDQSLSSVESQAAAIVFQHNCSNSTNNSKGRKKPKEQPNFPSVRTFFNEEYCYLMNAEKCGNIGRYLNHSCNPNCFVQSVFVDTHDLRFPWVALFALRHITAGSELTWDYNYSVGSVPGKILYCHCASKKCRGRLI